MSFNWSIIKFIVRGQNTWTFVFTLWDIIESKNILVQKVASEENLAIMFHKSMSRSTFKYFLELIQFDEV